MFLVMCAVYRLIPSVKFCRDKSVALGSGSSGQDWVPQIPWVSQWISQWVSQWVFAVGSGLSKPGLAGASCCAAQLGTSLPELLYQLT